MSNNLAYKNKISILLFYVLYAHSFFIEALSVSQLSLEEKVGQILVVHVQGQVANEDAKCLIQEFHIGGIIYYNWANGLTDPVQVQKLSQGLKQLAQQTPHALPLLIAVDQEGGRVNRLKNGFTLFPGNYALGQTNEKQWGEDSAWMMGQELRAVGVSLNLAPVVDVYTHLRNPVIGMRAFSSDPKEVAFWGQQALRGYKKAGIIAAFKHFPGHGDVEIDSHEVLPVVNKSRALLEQIELFPFRFLASEADVIMTSHLMIPVLDSQHCVTFSKKIVQNLLRTDLNFQGVIMTDSLAMEGILSQCSSIEEGVLKSFEAGHDLILLGGKQLLASQKGLEFTVDDIKRVHQFLVDSVKQGRLSENRLDEAVTRLLDLKQKYGLFDTQFLENSLLNTQVNTISHCALAQQIAQQALHLVQGQDSLPLTFEDESIILIAPDCLREAMTQTSWNALGSNVQMLYFDGLNPDQAVIQKIKTFLSQAKQCVYFSYNAWQFIGQQELFKNLVSTFPGLVTLVVCDPLDANELIASRVLLCTYSPVPCSLQAAFDYLTETK